MQPSKEYLRDNFFSHWLSQNMPPSVSGAYITDIDFVITHCYGNKYALVEKKTFGAKVPKAQAQVYADIKNGLEAIGKEVRAFCIQFEKSTFSNGWVKLNGKLVSEEQVRDTLREYCQK